VICAEPAQEEYPGGVQRQWIRPLAASIASVIPYVVVTKNASCAPPWIETPFKKIAEESAVPGSLTCCRRSEPTLAAVIPVAFGSSLLRCASQPNRVQSCVENAFVAPLLPPAASRSAARAKRATSD
jgi:hypothetical protein